MDSASERLAEWWRGKLKTKFMGREAKFRGKRKLNGAWVYGSLIQIGNDWCQIIPSNTEYDDVRNSMIRVISETVGEFTGLLDKNKTEIYEGDILKSKPYMFNGTYVIGQVIFKTERSQWLVEEIDDKWKDTEILFEVLQPSHETEIIGNIFDNPELLKGYWSGGEIN